MANADIPLGAEPLSPFPGNPPADEQAKTSLAEPEPARLQDPGSEEPLWFRRIKLVIFVMFSMWLGMILAVMPWLPVWADNNLINRLPHLRQFISYNFVRGAVSGLGLIDIWVGIWEAVHYREKKK